MTRRVQSEPRQVSRESAELEEDHEVQTDSAPSYRLVGKAGFIIDSPGFQSTSATYLDT